MRRSRALEDGVFLVSENFRLLASGTDYALMTSVSINSRSFKVATGRITGGGCTEIVESAEIDPNALHTSTHSLHDRGSLPLRCLILLEETVKEARLLLLVVGIEVPSVVERTRSELARLGVERLLDRLVGVETVLYNRHGLVTVQKVRVSGVDVTSLHSAEQAQER
jgi:hypothetical protein